MSDPYTCPPDCCDNDGQARPEPEPCADPGWTRYLRCVECGEPMTFGNCGPFGGAA